MRRLTGEMFFVTLVTRGVTVAVLVARLDALGQPVAARKFPGRGFTVSEANNLRLNGPVGTLKLPALLADVLSLGQVSGFLIQVS